MKTTVPRYTAQRRIASPLGEILLARTDAGLAGLWFEGQKDHPEVLSAPQAAADDAWLGQAEEQLDRFWRGAPVDFTVPLDLHGTPFQRAVWQALLTLSLGRTASYRDIALQIGCTSATRAVGAAVGRNPVSIIVPCHRVIGSSGGLTGYSGGLERKVALLRLEGVLAL
ncbi:methylated-DNA--[protein]-cysteine S-methyltransferase [Aquabacterium sp. A7-Y]|uniref:methylated-DNA--[protein]-cysteine S-methyltransferase n=1 Tax=Aquabacterium sp. A7-Y TaxID=1349605 RepID=UPI00223CC6B7|nr:methylated-DNA--[protein]-cysteine S-methyltransferase [Aquabacterium sp. A7-Y]MCW7538268.1 methylated-DNA--[protein]-cysteine S-methyltransferase [Aquabacterium sp. A7-Y]